MTTTARKPPARKPQVTVIPDGVKQPEDRKPKAEEAEVVKHPAPVTKDVPARKDPKTGEESESGKEVTYRGVTVFISDDALNDFELLGDIRAMQDADDPSYFPSLTRRLVGNEGYREVMDAIRSENGRVLIEDGIDWIQSVFEAIQAGNS